MGFIDGRASIIAADRSGAIKHGFGYYVRVYTPLTLTILSSVLFPLSQPNELLALGSPLIGLIALIPYYIALTRTRTAKDAARLGALFGTLSTILGNYWLMFFEDYSFWTIGGTSLAYAAFNFVLAGFLWLATRADRPFRPVLFAMIWTVYELFKSIGFLGYPWGLAAYPMASVLAAVQLASFTGVWGISFLVMYFNTSLAELLLRRAWTLRAPALQNVILATVLAGAALVFGLIRLGVDPIPDQTIEMVLVQQNADAWNTTDVSRPLKVAQDETLEALSQADDPDLIVWSETSLRYLFPQGMSWYERNPSEFPFTEFVPSLPAPFLTGAPFQDPDDKFAVYNSALLFDGDLAIQEWYAKRQLVPFAESIPFFDVPAVRDFFREVVGLVGTWTPGPLPSLFVVESEAGPVRIATPICFEDAFAGVVRRFVAEGADVLVNLTNNSWSRTNSAQTQHFVAAMFRSVESQRTLVRSTNSGYTAVIDPRGRVLASLPMFVTDSLAADVPVFRPEIESTYQRYGDYFPVGLLIVLLVLLGRFSLRQIRRRNSAPEPRAGISPAT